jgi:hypothetical protein
MALTSDAPIPRRADRETAGMEHDWHPFHEVMRLAHSGKVEHLDRPDQLISVGVNALTTPRADGILFVLHYTVLPPRRA